MAMNVTIALEASSVTAWAHAHGAQQANTEYPIGLLPTPASASYAQLARLGPHSPFQIPATCLPSAMRASLVSSLL